MDCYYPLHFLSMLPGKVLQNKFQHSKIVKLFPIWTGLLVACINFLILRSADPIIRHYEFRLSRSLLLDSCYPGFK